MNSYDPAGSDALSSASDEEGGEIIEREGTGLKCAPLPHQRSHSPSLQLTHTISIQSNTKIQVNKGSSRTDIARWLVAWLCLFKDRVSPRGQERARPDSVAQQRPS